MERNENLGAQRLGYWRFEVTGLVLKEAPEAFTSCCSACSEGCLPIAGSVFTELAFDLSLRRRDSGKRNLKCGLSSPRLTISPGEETASFSRQRLSQLFAGRTDFDSSFDKAETTWKIHVEHTFTGLQYSHANKLVFALADELPHGLKCTVRSRLYLSASLAGGSSPSANPSAICSRP